MRIKLTIGLLAFGLAAPQLLASITSPDGDGIKASSETPLWTLLGIADKATLNTSAQGNFTVAADDAQNQYSSLLIEIAGNANNNVFGIYNLNDKNQVVPIFAGSASPITSATLLFNTAADTVTVAGGGTLAAPNGFGFYLTGPGGTFYSRTADNVSGAFDQMAAIDITQTKYIQAPYNTQNSGWILAWEDVKVGGGADRDFNDMVMTFTAQPIPEPTTILAGSLLLLPFASSTLRFIRRSRKA